MALQIERKLPMGSILDRFTPSKPAGRAKAKRGAKTLFDRFGHLFGADTSKAFPPDASARIKQIIRERTASKRSR
jgi:hypothetical protein